jgi:hypothetical protein
MSPRLIHIHRGPTDDRHAWTPFAPSNEFNRDWWDSPPYRTKDPHYVRADQEGVEVARLELDHDFQGSQHVGAPKLGASALEIQFMEVAATRQRQGIGATVVRLLQAEYPDRRLLALSQDADGFWASMGWERFDHRDGPRRYRPLFIAPLGHGTYSG